tara:strand:+ start:1329 stop:1469 length:141 start_codon:yes stop_codon:yes gene_type:complete
MSLGMLGFLALEVAGLAVGLAVAGLLEVLGARTTNKANKKLIKVRP